MIIPALRRMAEKIDEFRDEDSDGGKKLTASEWEVIILEVLVSDMAPKLVDILDRANK